MAFLAARPTYAQKRLAGTLAALLFVLFAPLPSSALLGEKADRSPALTLPEARGYMLELINRDRTSEGLSPLSLDDTACGAAQEHSDEMSQWGYISHWDLQGRKPDQRYCEAGGDGAVFENVYTNHNNPNLGSRKNALCQRQLFSRKEIEQAEAWFFHQEAPRDGHRRNILDPHHNGVGIGLSLSTDRRYGSRITVAQEFVHRVGEIADLPEELTVGDPQVLSGRLEKGMSLHSVQVCHEKLPLPMTTADLKHTASYGFPTQNIASYFPGGQLANRSVAVTRKGVLEEFSVKLTADKSWQSGLYYIIVWVRDGSGGQPFVGSTRVVKMGGGSSIGPVASGTARTPGS